MIYINRDGFLPDIAWLAKAKQLTEDLLNAVNTNERNKIIDDNESFWGEIKDFLLNISHGKCWYSESKDGFNHPHVDHFRPKKIALGIDKKDKGGYWWLTFDWKNYRLSGGVGNVKKRDKFPVKENKADYPNIDTDDEIIYFLDPCEEEDVLKLTFNSDGEIIPIDSSGWDYEKAKYTIENLNLNFKLLKEKRKDVWAKCNILILETQDLMMKNKLIPSSKRNGQISEKIRQLRDLAKPTSEYSATAKTCLLSSGLIWAMKIAA